MKNEFQVSGINCIKCVNKLKETIGMAPGISQLHVDKEMKVVTIDFDESIINENKIKEMIEAVPGKDFKVN